MGEVPLQYASDCAAARDLSRCPQYQILIETIRLFASPFFGGILENRRLRQTSSRERRSARHSRRQRVDSRIRHRLRNQRARHLRARRSPAPERKTRRRSRGHLHGPRARQANHQGSACQRRRPRHPRCRRRILQARSASLGALARRRNRERKFRSDPHRPPERRSGLRPDRRPARRTSRPAARDHHHGRSKSPRAT